MKRSVELVLYPGLALAALIAFLYPAFLAPATFRLPSILVALFGMVTCCYLFYWCQHPGIYKSKSGARWLWHIGLATALLVLAPIVAVLGVTGIAHLIAPGTKLNKLLGLELRFEPGERVRIRPDAVSSFRPGALGRVRSARLFPRPNLGTPYAEEGTILYLVEWEGGACVEIPEKFLKEA